MSEPRRAPLAPLPHGTLGSNVAPSPPSALASGPARKLAPIFLRQKRAPRISSPNSSDLGGGDDITSDVTQGQEDGNGFPGPSRPKRARVSSPLQPLHSMYARHPLTETGDENTPPAPAPGSSSDGPDSLGTHGLEAIRKHERVPSIPNYFATTQLRTSHDVKEEARAEVSTQQMEIDEGQSTVWRRRRMRLGINGRRNDVLSRLDHYTFGVPQTPYLRTLVHHTSSLSPNLLPSVILLPSYHAPTGTPRDFAPPMTLAFSKSAKTYSALEAAAAGQTRLLAVANEEGGVQILNVDEPMGTHRLERGMWFRAHTNAVFDITWSGDDKHLLTASGDQSSRIHSLDSGSPRLIATLKGHTSTPKTVTFFDPSRSACYDQHDQRSSVVASAGRDGNILIFDLRCPGRASPESSDSEAAIRDGVPRYANGVPGFMPSTGGDILDPVMVIKAAHGDGHRRQSSGRTAIKSVTTLAALQAMPGVLASGGSSDGIVKLWDLRFAPGTSRSAKSRCGSSPLGQLPDPTLVAPGARRSRSVMSIVESPTTGDLYALCGDSKIHTLRPSAYHDAADPTYSPEAIRPEMFTDPNLLVNNFYIRLAISPCGKYLSSGSTRGGVLSWNVRGRDGKGNNEAVRLRLGMGGTGWAAREKEVSVMDWGKDVLAACADDCATRVWRADHERARSIKEDPKGEGEGWLGCF